MNATRLIVKRTWTIGGRTIEQSAEVELGLSSLAPPADTAGELSATAEVLMRIVQRRRPGGGGAAPEPMALEPGFRVVGARGPESFTPSGAAPPLWLRSVWRLRAFLTGVLAALAQRRRTARCGGNGPGSKHEAAV